MAKPYSENLSRLLKVGYKMSDANKFAKIITNAQKLAEKKKLMEEINKDLKECGLDKYAIEGDLLEDWFS